MLTRIVRPSPALDTFLRPLIGSLSLPQRQHLLEMTDALLVTEDRKTLAALQRQFLDTSDPANWADFLRISPWSADLLRDKVDEFACVDSLARWRRNASEQGDFIAVDAGEKKVIPRSHDGRA